MCGIVAASSHQDITDLLISGLQTLEYRGYDSAGIAVHADGQVRRERIQGKVSALQALLTAYAIQRSECLVYIACKPMQGC